MFGQHCIKEPIQWGTRSWRTRRRLQINGAFTRSRAQLYKLRFRILLTTKRVISVNRSLFGRSVYISERLKLICILGRLCKNVELSIRQCADSLFSMDVHPFLKKPRIRCWIGRKIVDSSSCRVHACLQMVWMVSDAFQFLRKVTLFICYSFHVENYALSFNRKI